MDRVLEIHGLRVLLASSMEDLPLLDPRAIHGVLWEASDGAEEFLRALRGRVDLVLMPSFLASSGGAVADALADGVDLDHQAMGDFIRDVALRGQDLAEHMLRESLDYRLLAFLYTRPQREISPILLPLTSQVYRWPLLDALGGGLLEPSGWVSSLLERGFIAPSGLVERVRYCPRCGGGHINYVDLCPFCSSMDFEQVPFIHCFVCGRVGPEEDFLRSGEMRCPFCGSRLRHIGSDYDRPMENYYCHDCGKSFQDPHVSCHCLICGQISEPDELVPRNFYRYRLSDKGVLAVQSGELEDRYAVLDTLNYMKPDPFMHILDWMIGLSKRPPVEPFCLMLVRFPNLEEFMASMGTAQGAVAFRELIGRIREMIRTTDVSTRTEAGELLLLLPKTPRSGGSVLKSRIEALVDKVEHRQVPLKIDIKIYSVPEDLQKSDNGQVFLGRLRGL